MACPATARLQHKAQFQQGLDQRIVARSPHFALHAPAHANPAPNPDMNCSLIGAVIPKRWAKRAVTRNTIRRQIYQVWSEWSDRMPHGIHVVRLRQGFEAGQFLSATSAQLRLVLRQELQQLFSQQARP